MASIRLEIVEGEGKGKAAVLTGISVLGRDPTCAFVIPDQTVSREHAVLTPEKEFGFVIEDMGSSSGTWVNGQRTRRAVLQDGDRVRIGRAELKVSALRAPLSGEVPPDEVDVVADAHPPTARLSLDALKFSMQAQDLIERMGRVAGDAPEVDGRAEVDRLEHLVGIAIELARVRQPSELAQRVASRLVSMFPRARRVAVFELLEVAPDGEVPHELSPLCVLDRERKKVGSGRIRINQAILQQAIAERRAILTEEELDPAGPAGPPTGASAILCAPLLLGDKVQGAVYLDATDPDPGFSEACLRLLTAVAAVLAAALGNARLFAQVHDEAARRGSLERYFSQSLVDRVMAGEVRMALEGEQVNGTILFVDVRDFTRLTDTTPPPVLVRTLNAYFAAMQRIIFRLEGTVERFGGDSILAYWGVVEEDPWGAARCVSAALAILAELFHLNPELKARGQPELRVGIGINTGEVIAGAVGSPQRFEYTIFGDAINLARRLESQAGPWEVMVGADTVRALGRAVLQLPLPPRSMKGKDQAVALAAVYGLLHRDEADPSGRPRARPHNTRYDLALPATLDLEGQLAVTLVTGLELTPLETVLLEVLSQVDPDAGARAKVAFTLPRSDQPFTALGRVHADLDVDSTAIMPGDKAPLRPVQRILLTVDNGRDLLRFLDVRR